MRHFILAHKEFDFPLSHSEKAEDFTILTEDPNVHGVAHHYSKTREAKSHTGQDIVVGADWSDSTLIKRDIVKGVNNWQLGEIPAWTYIYSQLKDGEYACLHHYRRKLLGPMDNSCCTAGPMAFKCSVAQQTANCHSNTMVRLLQKHLRPEDFKILSDGNLFFPYNIFCADKATIKEWLDFENHVIGEIVRQDTGADIEHFIRMDYGERGGDTFEPRPGKNIHVDYQRRFFAFMSERLNTIFWTWKTNAFYNRRRSRYQKECVEQHSEFDLRTNFDDGFVIPLPVQLLEENQTI